MRYFETLKDAHALDNHRVEVTFKGGRVGLFDCQPYFSAGYYKPLRDPALFGKAHVSLGDLAWPGDIDIGADDVWDEATPKAGKGRRGKFKHVESDAMEGSHSEGLCSVVALKKRRDFKSRRGA